MARAAAVLGKSLARDIQFVEYPITPVREQSEDMALMLEWFERVSYGADIAALDAEFGPMTRLDNRAAKTLSA
jgi:hypothetical protein